MSTDTIYEKGDSLEALAIKARQWFDSNNVVVPSGAKMWQECSVRRGEIPPGTGVTSLRRYGFNVTAFISSITSNPDLKPYKYNPINSNNIGEIGFELVSEKLIKGHKRLTVKCLKCGREEELDYGTLQRMKSSSNTHCRYCRNAGGKCKDLQIYDVFAGFSIKGRTEDHRLIYQCNSCKDLIERTQATVSSSEYIVCEKCHPRENFGARLYTELGYFDSYIEFEAYKILLRYLDSDKIIRQKKYDELFGTGTKHTADFYIPSINLILEVTTSSNNLGTKYKDTAAWKLSLSNNVKFAYSLREVEDIVRPLVKIKGLAVDNRRNVFCCRTGRR
jgi:DNA-directed RNA polymerase subunit RPC12/RpoP